LENNQFDTMPDPAMAHRAREDATSPANTVTESTITDTSATTLTSENPVVLNTESPTVADVLSSAGDEEPPTESSPASAPPQQQPASVESQQPASVDKVADTPSPATAAESNTSRKKAHRRRGSGTSGLSVDSTKDGKGRGRRGGIKIGASKPAGSVVTSTMAGNSTGSSDEGAWKAAGGP
jgi:hypothetical protein